MPGYTATRQRDSLAGAGSPSLPRAGSERAVALVYSGSFQLLIALLFTLAAFRAVALALNNTDLFVDEAQYWSWSLEPAFGYFSKPPLLAWIIGGTTPLCGDSEFCIRLPSIFIHLATSIAVYFVGLQLFSKQVGFWSAITFATLPGISVSSGIISTDVPLLLAWAVALLAFAELVKAPSLAISLVLGLALGIGLNAKYAMAYFVPCAAVFFLMAPEKSSLLRRPNLWISAALAVMLITPNLLWNAANGFVTLSHTASNANWSGQLFHPGKALEFLGAQFGVFGPILFGSLLVIVWRARHSIPALPWQQRLLIAFSFPIILALTIQGLLSRSLANWAAPAYVAATVLVVNELVRRSEEGWLRISLAIHLATAVVLAIATWQSGNFKLPGGGDPFARTLGNRNLADAVSIALDDGDGEFIYASVLTDGRDTAAALTYYGRHWDIPVYSWRQGGPPQNHFELVKAFDETAPDPVLLVSARPSAGQIAGHFRTVRALGTRSVAAGEFESRTVHLFALAGYKGS